MGFLELLMVAVGLSMDAFAVSLGKGLSAKKPSWRYCGVIALFFGGFQAVMPLIGWLFGKQFERYITSVDHWIAFGLLAFIGCKMISESGNENCPGDVLNIRELFLLAVATSIDALAAGITFAFLQVSILPAVSLIGATTFILSFGGVAAGRRFGGFLKRKAETAGGIVLILIGLEILLGHLGIF